MKLGSYCALGGSRNRSYLHDGACNTAACCSAQMMLRCGNIRLILLYNKDKDRTRQAHTHHSEVSLLVFESLDASAVFCAS